MLPTLLQIGASNALTAALLVVGVAAVCRIAGRPALTRALWVLVLIKLLTPPLWSVPLDGFFARSPNARAPQPTGISTSSPLPMATDTAEIDNDESAIPIAAADAEPARDVSFDQAGASSRSDNAAVKPTKVDWALVGNGIAAAWEIGTAVCLLVVFKRVWRFNRSLRLTALAPGVVQERCEALAYRLGLRSAPKVLFVPSVVCPSLWAFSRPAIILASQSLWDRLDADQQDSLLVHELAHLRRRDHWVRLLELAATLVYWWHPVVWFARRRLHEAEEQCCDAWVLATLPASGKCYAAALLEAIDFISVPHVATPALASGLGDFSSLKRRIVMIQNGSVRKALSWTGAMAVLGVACVVLPVAPSFGQESPKEEKVDAEKKIFFLAPSDVERKTEEERPSSAEADAIRGKTDMAIKQTQQEIDQLSAEMAKVHAALEQATGRLKKLEAMRSGDGVVRKTTAVDPNSARITYPLGAKSAMARVERLDRLERQVEQIMVELKQLKAADQFDAAKRNFEAQRP